MSELTTCQQENESCDYRRLRAELAAEREKVKELWGVIHANTNREMTMRHRFFVADDYMICDENFDFDAALKVTGDFVDDEKARYAQMIACTLNDYSRVSDELAAAQAVIERMREASARWDAIETLMILGNVELNQAEDGGFIIYVEPVENMLPTGWDGDTPEQVADKVVHQFALASATPTNIDALHEDRAREAERLAEIVHSMGDTDNCYGAYAKLCEEAAAHRAKKQATKEEKCG